MQFRTFPLAVNVNPPPFFICAMFSSYLLAISSNNANVIFPSMKEKTSAFVLRGLRHRTFLFGMSKKYMPMASAKISGPGGWRGGGWRGGWGRQGQKWTRKKSSFASVERKTKEGTLNRSWGTESDFLFFFSECQYKHLHIQASLQDLSLVPRSVYINPNTSKTLPFRSLVMAKAEIKQYGWIKAATGDLNFTHHWSLCIFDSS